MGGTGLREDIKKFICSVGLACARRGEERKKKDHETLKLGKKNLQCRKKYLFLRLFSPGREMGTRKMKMRAQRNLGGGYRREDVAKSMKRGRNWDEGATIFFGRKS